MSPPAGSCVPLQRHEDPAALLAWGQSSSRAGEGKGARGPLAEGHCRVTGEGERLVSRAANLGLGHLKLMALVLSTGCLEGSLWPWKTPVASKLECKLVAAGVSGVCASLDPWLCFS